MKKIARSRKRSFRLVATTTDQGGHVFRLVGVNERGNPVGEHHHRSKLTNADCELVLALWDDGRGLSYAAIAAKFDDIPGGISKSTVRDICSGRYRGQVPVALVRRAVIKR